MRVMVRRALIVLVACLALATSELGIASGGPVPAAPVGCEPVPARSVSDAPAVPLWSDIDAGSELRTSAFGLAIDPVTGVAQVAESSSGAFDDDARFRTVTRNVQTGQHLRTKMYDDPVPPVETDSWYDGPAGIAVDPVTSAYYVTGRVALSEDNAGIRTLAYSAAGRLLWTDRYVGAEAQALAVDAARSTVYVVGSGIADFDDNRPDNAYHVVAYDAATGVRKWVATGVARQDFQYGGPVDVVVDAASGTLVVTGELTLSDPAAVTAAWSPSGALLWEVREPGAGAVALAVSRWAAVVTGTTAGDLSTRSLALASGRLRWQVSQSNPRGASCEAAGIAVNPTNGTVFVTGWTLGRNADFYTVAITATGRQIWSATYDGADPRALYDQATDVVVDPARGVVHVLGNVEYEPNPPLGGPNDVALVSYSAADGRQVQAAQYHIDGANLDAAGLAIDAATGITVIVATVFDDSGTTTLTAAYRSVE